MVVQRCLLVRNTRQPESLVMHFPFLLLLKLDSDIGEAHLETWPNPRWPPHISIQNYFKFILIELNALWFALVSCCSTSMGSRQTLYDYSCFGSERYKICLWGLRKRVTGSSELVKRTMNYHRPSWHFVLRLLHWDAQKHQDHGSQCWKFTSLHLLDRHNIHVMWM